MFIINILIADDNTQICHILRDYSIREGFKVFMAHSGKTALDTFNQNTIDIVLLDVMMPEIDGFEVCKRIREASNVPVIMITARGEDYDRIMGLDIGADDYIIKPFSPNEVMARIRAIMRRMDRGSNKASDNKLHIDNLSIDIESFQVHIDNTLIQLTRKETEILYTLATNKSKIFTRESLLDTVWGYDYTGDLRTVDSHIKRLRAKLDKYNHPLWDIKTIWGVGYKLEVKDHEK